MPTRVQRLGLSAAEAGEVRGLLDEIMADESLLDQFRFVERAGLLAQRLPARLREAFYRFKRAEAAAALHVTGSPVLPGGAAPTPARYVETEAGFRLNDAQLLLGLYGSLLGEAVGFTSQRGGSIYNTIIPLPEYAGTANSSSGSDLGFGFHVEDAFHPARAEFIGLACLRNDERAATTVSCVDGADLDDAERALLFEPRFEIGSNPIHRRSGAVPGERAPVFFGHPASPYVAVNFATLRLEDYAGAERRALEKLRAHFERNREPVVLGAGEFIFIDNYRCVHARDAFTPLYGGRARWLCRVVFTSDLRKSRGFRSTAGSRAIAA